MRCLLCHSETDGKIRWGRLHGQGGTNCKTITDVRVRLLPAVSTLLETAFRTRQFVPVVPSRQWPKKHVYELSESRSALRPWISTPACLPLRVMEPSRLQPLPGTGRRFYILRPGSGPVWQGSEGWNGRIDSFLGNGGRHLLAAMAAIQGSSRNDRHGGGRLVCLVGSIGGSGARGTYAYECAHRAPYWRNMQPELNRHVSGKRGRLFFSCNVSLWQWECPCSTLIQVREWWWRYVLQGGQQVGPFITGRPYVRQGHAPSTSQPSRAYGQVASI